MVKFGFFVLIAASIMGCATAPTPDSPYGRGLSLLAETKAKEKKSRDMILQASKIRKTLSQKHRQKWQEQSPEDRHRLSGDIGRLKAEMIELRRQGAGLRSGAVRTKQAALLEFRRGMESRFDPWIEKPGPIILASNKGFKTAHNPKIASAKPQVMARGLPITDLLTMEDYRSLVARIPAEQNAPENLDVSSFQISRERTMVAHIEVADREARGVPLGKIHSWRLVVSDTNGEPVAAEFEVLGHMPGHVHGLPTKPRIQKQLDDGVYLVEGLKFQMGGWWVMEFAAEDDRIRFNVVL